MTQIAMTSTGYLLIVSIDYTQEHPFRFDCHACGPEPYVGPEADSLGGLALGIRTHLEEHEEAREQERAAER